MIGNFTANPFEPTVALIADEHRESERDPRFFVELNFNDDDSSGFTLCFDSPDKLTEWLAAGAAALAAALAAVHQ